MALLDREVDAPEADAARSRAARWDPGFAYLMTGIALACIWLSYLMGAVFGPAIITGTQHDYFNSAAAIGWIWNGIATGVVVSAALMGFRSKVADKAPWAMLGTGVSAIWLAVMFVAVFAPPWVTGTDPDQFPFWAGMAATAGVILTWILCRFVKAVSFEPGSPSVGATTAAPANAPLMTPEVTDEATVKLRQLAQLRDSGVITEAEFQAKKTDLLSRI